MKIAQPISLVILSTLALAGPLKPRAATDACVAGVGAGPNGAPAFYTPFVCDGGTCKAPDGGACGNFGDGDCRTGKYCIQGICQDFLAIGGACHFGSAGDECQSGFCAGKSDGSNMGKCAMPSSNTPDGNQCFAPEDGTDPECGTDSYCFASDAGPGNVCTAKGAPGGRCLYEVKNFSCLSVCHFRFSPYSKTCLDTKKCGKASTGTGNLGDGEPCAADNECKSKSCLDTKKCGTQGTTLLTNGAACSASSQCSSNDQTSGILHCEASNNRAENAKCSQDTQCQASKCAAGLCKTTIGTNPAQVTVTVGQVVTQVITQNGVPKTVVTTAATAGLVRATVASTSTTASKSGCGLQAVSSTFAVAFLVVVPLVLL
ncbi:hypothetical protein RQP46_001465 [Phenoliferia psychrophenolica]